MSYNNFTYNSHPRKRHNTEWLDARDENDHIYYNITIRNENPQNNNRPVLAKFEEERVQPLIDNPNDYYLTITRFTVPGSEIPIFIFPIQEFPNLNPNLSPFSVTLQHNGNIQQEFIIYSTRDLDLSPPTPPTANNPQWSRTSYYFVYSYYHMIDMINTALQTAFDNLATKPVGSIAPRLDYNQDTEFISWNIQRAFYDNALPDADRIDIFINTPLLTYLEAISYFFRGYDQALGRDWQLVVKDNVSIYNQSSCTPSPVQSVGITTIPLGGPGSITITTASPHGLKIGDMIELVGTDSNPSIDGVYAVLTAPSPTTFTIDVDVAIVGAGGAGFVVKQCNFYKITQQFNSLYRWNSFKDIVFLTNQIPVVYEYIRSNAAGLVNFQPILTDFEPLLTEAGDARSSLQYFPQGPYRLINLNSSIPLKKIDVSVFWKDELNNLYPIQISKGQVLTIKLLFIKK